jgi:glycosyltransferase involved in cell wall biosynthesis
MSKRICVIRQEGFPHDTHVQKNVDALIDAGYLVDVVCLREPGAPAREAYRGGTVARLPLTHRRGSKARYLFEYTAFFLMSFALLAFRSLRRRYDAVEVYNMPDLLVFAALPARLRGAKVVLYLFELIPEQAQDDFGWSAGHPMVRLLRWIECRAVRFADRVIAVSPYDKRILQERTSPRAALAVILNVPDDELFAPRPAANSGSPGRLRVFTHGSVLRRYGIQTLVQAMPYVLREVPEAEAWILGRGEYRPALESLARELGVADHVRFVDWVPLEDVPSLIATADVGVVSTLLPRLLPNKLFEYAAMAKPVAVAAGPSIGAVFPKDAVAYFQPGDELDLTRRILELHDDRQRAQRLGEQARAVYERYRWSITKQAYVALHDELLAEAPAPGQVVEAKT